MYKIMLLSLFAIVSSVQAMDNSQIEKEEMKALRKELKRNSEKAKKLKNQSEKKQYSYFVALTKESLIVPYDPNNHRYVPQNFIFDVNHQSI